MKKKKLLTAMLSFVLVFSFLLSSSSMVFAEGNVFTENIFKQEVSDSSSDDMISDRESDENFSEKDTLDTEESSDKLDEENVEDGAVIEKIEPSFFRATRRVNGTPGYIAWLTSNQSQKYRHKLYVAVKGVTGTTEVAYCYNFEKKLPGSAGEDVSKIANASASDFNDLVGAARLRGEALKTKILQICYEGYPKNSKNLQTEYNLTEDEFCLITQAAIWYYTDSKDVISPGGYFYNLDYYRPIVTKSNVKNAFNRLINTSVQLPSNYELDLYYPTNGESRVQALLSTKFGGNTPKKHEFYLDKRKEDEQGLAGARLQLLYNNGNLIQEWISDGNAKLFEAEAGSYIFREIQAPTGYEKANDIHFNIDSNGNVTSNNGKVERGKKVVMIDRQSKPHIVIRKINPDGGVLAGADLQILSSDGANVIQQWTTDGTEKSIAIDAGDYIFRETKAPQGYDKVADVRFSVDDKGNITLNGTLDYAKVEGNKLIVTDSKEVPKTTRKVEKKWRDAGFEKERPESVKIQLLADGKPYDNPITLNDSNAWMYEWKELPKVGKDGREIEYEVKEVEMAGKTIGIDYIPDYKYKDNTFTVTNIKGLEMVISKEVIGNGGDKSKEFTFEIELNFMDSLTHKEPIKYEGSVLNGYENEVEAPEDGILNFDPKTMKATIKLKHGQQVTLKNILYTPYLMYTVKELEENQDGYKTTYNDVATPATGECTNHIKVNVKNSKEGTPPPTGIVENHKGTGVLIGMSALGLLLVAIGYISRLRKGIKQ